MALATQCPHCQTTFRVAHDQLKLRTGLVRCGHCKEIFNGIEHLLPPEEEPAATETQAAPADTPTYTPEFNSPPAIAAASSINDNAAANDAVEENDTADTESFISVNVAQADFDVPEAEPEIETALPVPETEEMRTDPLLRMTLMDFTRDLPDRLPGDTSNEMPDEISAQESSHQAEKELTSDSNGPDELDAAIEDLQRKPWRGAKKTTEKMEDEEDEEQNDASSPDEPGFLKRGRRKQQLGKKLRVFLGIGCCILLIAALLQGTYLFRNQIASLLPQIKPLLTQVCNTLGCRIDLPAQIAEVSIESSELQSLADNKSTFLLTTLMRNYSATPQTWPHIELTLNDGNEKPLLRRVFTPSDYLSDIEIRVGFAPGSEHVVKLSFELAQIKASGYRVYLFYP